MSSMTNSIIAKPFPPGVRQLIALLDRVSVGTLDLTTPEGTVLQIGDGTGVRADLQVNRWSALHKIFRHGDIGLAECYRDGWIECSDLTRLFRFGIRNQHVLESAIHGHRWLQIGYRLRHLFRANTRKGSRRNIEAHYDLSNDFYQQWLDPSMTYSSALFEDDLEGDLQRAQAAKYQRMLDLIEAKPGDSILEIGCGWGGFAEYAGERDISVFGVTLSQEQLVYAKARMERAGLADRVTLALRDYRDLDEKFDHIVSIEMLEAVGERYWPIYFRQLHALLKPGGRAAIQVITMSEDHFDDYRKGTDFIQQYIFPGGMLPSESRLYSLAEQSSLNVKSLTCFGRDYAETLRRWRRSFEQTRAGTAELGFDDAFTRLWRCYLCYCEAGFDERRIDVVHLQLEKGCDHAA